LPREGGREKVSLSSPYPRRTGRSAVGLGAAAGADLLEVRLDGVAVLGRHAAGQLQHAAGLLLLGQLAPDFRDLLELLRVHQALAAALAAEAVLLRAAG